MLALDAWPACRLYYRVQHLFKAITYQLSAFWSREENIGAPCEAQLIAQFFLAQNSVHTLEMFHQQNLAKGRHGD
jgi:hypothetical protein